MNKCKIYPVIHHISMDMTMANVQISIDAGCDGVFLIHMEGEDEKLSPVCIEIKKKHKDLFVGINRLSCSPDLSIKANLECGADATWVDNCGINNGEGNGKTSAIMAHLYRNKEKHLMFGAVAFKYQPHDNYPNRSAKLAYDIGFIPTTSGVGTGHAPETRKIESMGLTVGRENLAIASGMSPDNIHLFSPFCANFLVSTGISKSFYEFDLQLLKSLVENANK